MKSIMIRFFSHIFLASILIHAANAGFLNPTSNFTTTGQQCKGQPVSFIDNSSTTVGTIVIWSWDFGDGSGSNLQNPSHIFDSHGDHTVSLTVIDSNGKSSKYTATVMIAPTPTVDFSVSSNLCLLDDQSFTSDVSIAGSTIDSYKWEYGDGAISFTQHGSHKYSNVGNYDVTLTVKATNGCESSITKRVKISKEPTADFEVSDQCLGASTSFANLSSSIGGLTYLWDFGDGGISAQSNPTHTYATAGSYNVSLTVTDQLSKCSTTITKQTEVFALPKSNFAATAVCLGNPVIFTNNSAGNNLSYVWDFGDGSTSTDFEPSHSYANDGFYIVKLKVKSIDNCEDIFESRIDIYEEPNPSFFMANQCHGNPVLFSNLTSERSGAITYLWDFGDGNQSTNKSPSHAYESPGTYTVTLKATTGDDCFKSISKDLEIYSLPKPDFEAAVVCDGSVTNFTDKSITSSGSITSYLWDFGDLTNSVKQNPEKQYLNPGTYNVSLTVTSNNNCKTTITKQIEVKEVPVANFLFEDVCFGDPVVFKNTSSAASDSFVWDFGDGEKTTTANTTHLYSQPGTYTVTLTAKSSADCENTVTKTILVRPLPEVDAGSDTTISRGTSAQLNAKGGNTYQWRPIDGLSNSNIANPVARPLETTSYIVTITDSFGCQNQDTVVVTLREDFRLVTNNVFTPDGNGQNDTWIVPNADAFDRVEVKIYDKYGVLVFEDQDYKDTWQGTSGSDILPDGTYYYLITFPDTEKNYSGAITILRNR